MISRLKFRLDDLANEMLDQLPVRVFESEITTFLDPCMGGGQFVRAIEQRLRSYGHCDKNIAKRVFGIESSRLRVNYAINKHGLVGQYRYCENYLESDENMKFDVVIGNPPYQDAVDTGKSLWPSFTEKGVSVLVPGGKLCFITPTSWIGKKSKGGKSSYAAFNDFYMELLVMMDGKRKNTFFPAVGTTICWFIITNEHKNDRSTLVRQYHNNKIVTHDMKIEEGKEYPSFFTNKTVSIHKKLTNVDSFKFVRTRELHYHTMKRLSTVSEGESKKYPYKSYFSHKLIRYASYKMKDHDDWKIMVPQTATIKDSVVDHKCNVSEDLFYIKCPTKEVALNAQSLFNTKIYRYISEVYRKGRNMSGFSIFPKVDLTRAWTDEELYEHFGLTKEEIDYIETAVK